MVRELSAQDVSKCQACLDCDLDVWDGMDIPLSSVVQLILQDDLEVLQCRTVWCDSALDLARGACKRGLDLQAVIFALRQIDGRRRSPH
jgi:hypothetical protein